MYHEKKTSLYLIDCLKRFLLVPVLAEQYKETPTAFNRNRKLPFPYLVSCMLQALRKRISLELNAFYNRLVEIALAEERASLSASAFCQSRQKLKPEFFRDGMYHLLQEFYSDNDATVKLWKGKRLLAVDGSVLELPQSSALEKTFGGIANGGVRARMSLLYDVLNEMVLDGVLAKYNESERSLASLHLAHAQQGDLILYDRGYSGFEGMHQHHQQGIDFVIRVGTGFCNAVKDFVASGLPTQQILMQADKKAPVEAKPYTYQTTLAVRLIRVELPTGEIEVLMSSLLDTQTYPSAIFKELYFKRWGIETRYDILKNTLQVEHFSGITEVVIQQDFFITLLIANLEALLREEVNQQLRKTYTHRKYDYQVSISACVSLLREKIVALLLGEQPQKILEYLTTVFSQHIEPIRKDRSFPRRKDQYHKKLQPKAFKNRKNNL